MSRSSIRGLNKGDGVVLTVAIPLPLRNRDDAIL